MDIEEVRTHALTMPGAEEDMPYGADWIVFRIEGKIFLHIWLESPEPSCAVKMEPDKGAERRERYNGVQPAYHLNKIHWNDLYLDTLPDSMVKEWIQESYRLVLSKLPRSLRDKYCSGGDDRQRFVLPDMKKRRK